MNRRHLDVKKRINEATPLICVFLYLLLGFQYEEWLWGLFVFALIPLSNMFLTDNSAITIRTLVPLIAIAVFLVLWLQFDQAHPGWLVFLLIPIVNTIAFGKDSEKEETLYDDDIY